MLNNAQQKKLISLYNAGFSASQVADKLNMSISGINYYLQKYNVKKRNISNSIILINQTKFGKKPFILKTKLTQEAQRLKTAGIMLYWAEGSKSGGGVTFTNSDPEMIKFFMTFLRQICGVSEERLRISLHAYSDQNIKYLQKYWSEVTNLPLEQFHRPYIHKKKEGNYTKISRYGTVAVQYSDVQLLRIIFRWIQEETGSMNIHCHRSSVG